MSAPDGGSAEEVRTDSGGHPGENKNAQAGPHFAGELVRPGVPARPLAADTVEGMSAPDTRDADSDRADKPAPDTSGADNGADVTADITPLAADNGDADRRLPRGAIAAGVRKQLAVGVTDPGVITDRLSEALGLTVDKKTVARLVRREQQKNADPEPVPGQYL